MKQYLNQKDSTTSDENLQKNVVLSQLIINKIIG